VSGIPHLGGYDSLEEILASATIDELVVALDPAEAAMIQPILEAAGNTGTHLTLIPIFNEFIPANPTVRTQGNTTLINLRSTRLDHPGWALVKRSMDVLGSVILIVLTSPLMALTAIGVKLSSPGPVIFAQERIGLNKRPFLMYKFRSMRVNNSAETGWSTASDPRKTPFGTFIRRYSLDELPQLFNVLRGDMSLVGPRPEIPYHVERFKKNIPLYLVRQQIRPGMTGWAQVNGLRGDTSIEDRVDYDIWYIENWSLWLDIRILLKTAFGGMVSPAETEEKV
jgi:Undecaprenyl-phosphate glucose phosphotransferase